MGQKKNLYAPRSGREITLPSIATLPLYNALKALNWLVSRPAPSYAGDHKIKNTLITTTISRKFLSKLPLQIAKLLLHVLSSKLKTIKKNKWEINAVRNMIPTYIRINACGTTIIDPAIQCFKSLKSAYSYYFKKRNTE